MAEEKRKNLQQAMEDKGFPADYVEYEPGDDTVCLDGHFTIEQLQFIVDWMKLFQTKSA